MGDRRKCQTYTASPAEPGGLPVMLERDETPRSATATALVHVLVVKNQYPFAPLGLLRVVVPK